jgi:hypothetical protein
MYTRIVRWAAVAALAGALLGSGAAHASRSGNPRAQHASQRPQHMALLGQVSGVATSGFQLQPVYTMPLSVTVGVSTTITVAGMPGTIADIQSGRFVNVAGRFDTTQQTLDANRVDIVVPTVSGWVTAVDGAAFTMSSDGGATFQVTTTSSTKITSMPGFRGRGHPGGPGNKHGQRGPGNQQGQGSPSPDSGAGTTSATITVAANDRVVVQAFPPAAGTNTLAALRISVGGVMPGPAAAAMDSSD